MKKLTNKQILTYAKKHKIEREEVYEPMCPSHWPQDRCYRFEDDNEFVSRVRKFINKQIK